LIPSLQHLSQPEPVYLAWWKGIEVTSRVSPRIDEVEIIGLKRVGPELVQRYLHATNGSTIRPTEINRDLLRMYGDGYYESVDYTVLTQRERNILRVTPIEKSWGPDYLRLALNLETSTNSPATFGLRAAYHKTLLNSLGAEFITSVDVGFTNRLLFDFYQPLDRAQRFFVSTAAGVQQSHMDIYLDDQRVANYATKEAAVSVYAGMNIGLLGQVRLGWLERDRRFELDTGIRSLPNFSTRFGGVRATLDFDQFDRMYFPTRGWSSRIQYFDSREAGYSRLDAEAMAAVSFGDTVFNGRLAYTGSPNGRLPGYDAGSLGGFRNMSAYAKGQIIGDDISYVSLGAEQIIGRLPLGLRGDMRLGIALEAAKAGFRYTEQGSSGVLNSLAVYLGGETPFGPSYLGFGYSTSGVYNFFLSVGVK
jgi:NTE family protein